MARRRGRLRRAATPSPEQLFRPELLQHPGRGCLGPAIWNASDPRQLNPHLGALCERQKSCEAWIPGGIAGAVRKSEAAKDESMAVGQERLCQALTSFDATRHLQLEAQLEGGFKGFGQWIWIVQG